MMHFKNCSLIVSTSVLALADVGYGQVVSLPCTTDGTAQTTVCGTESLSDQGLSQAFNGTAFGFQALSENQGGQNTAIGAWALQGNLGGSFNTAVGSESLRTNQAGSFNTGIGYSALNVTVLQQSGSYNTAAGAGSLQNNAGSSNTGVGYNALQGAPYEVSTGTGGGQGGFNTAIGAGALFSNSTGVDNTAAGYQALYSNTIGGSNTALGLDAMYKNTTGNENTATGYQALSYNLSGSDNVATGVSSLFSNTTGSNNTALGFGVLFGNATGSSNTAAGFEAMRKNKTGIDNTAYGTNALYADTAGSNTAIGYEALKDNTSGKNNVALGWEAGLNVKTGSNNIDIANPGVATDGEVADNGVIRIGTQSPTSTLQTTTFIAGIYGNSSVTGLEVVVDSTGQLGTMSSSERFKTDIAPMASSTGKLEQLRPVTFHYKSDTHGTLRYGLIAEEVATVYPELVVRDTTGRIDGVRYDELAPMLLNELQKQQQKLAAEDALISQLVKQQAELQAAFAKLQSKDELVAKR
jgi:hypothetical protein